MKTRVKFLCKILSFLLVFILISGSFGCSSKGSAVDFYYFKTQIHVQSESKKISDKTANKIDNILRLLDQTFSASQPNSFTCSFNSSKVGNVDANEHVIKVLTACKDLYTITEKTFNPAVKPLIDLWQFDKYPVANFTPPSDLLIEQVLSSNALDFDKIVIDEENQTVYKPIDDMQIDLGGIAKGYATDLIYQILIDDGYEDGYVNVGGSSLCLVSEPALSVAHPRKDGSIIKVKTIGQTGLFVSTSGDYQRYYEFNGVRYSHLIDGLTGAPADTGIISATITGASGIILDALSTALCVVPYENGELNALIDKILFNYPNAKIYLVYQKDDVKQIITNASEIDVAVIDTEYQLVLI